MLQAKPNELNVKPQTGHRMLRAHLQASTTVERVKRQGRGANLVATTTWVLVSRMN